VRIDPTEYRGLELRAHTLLADVPLHDVWAVDLPGGRPGVTVEDLRAIASAERLGDANVAVRLLFRLRSWLGGLFDWDRQPEPDDAESFIHRLSEADRSGSRVAPGTRDGPFQLLYVSSREAVSEIRNATVHAFSVYALVERAGGYRLYWAIYVRPVGPLTVWYMGLIDPFRRWIIYPAVLRALARGWARHFA
jgi:hypothetical protein